VRYNRLRGGRGNPRGDESDEDDEPHDARQTDAEKQVERIDGPRQVIAEVQRIVVLGLR
jgi:hypothetical protein